MAEKSLQELEREKLEWEIRALKRASKSGGPWLGLLFLLNLTALVYIGNLLLEVNRDDVRSQRAEVERILVTVEAKESEATRLRETIEQREKELEDRIARTKDDSEEYSNENKELKDQIARCQALVDKTWDQRVALLEALDRIDEVWKTLPETMTFAQLKKLRAVEDQIINMRTILEDIEAPE